MKTLPKYLQDQKNEMTYVLHGDYYFPDLKLSNSDKTPISHYGRMRLKHLQMNRPGRYTRLLLSGMLCTHLAEIDKTCQERMYRMTRQTAIAEGINEAMKTKDPMAWVARMIDIRHQVEEVILAELIYE